MTGPGLRVGSLRKVVRRGPGRQPKGRLGTSKLASESNDKLASDQQPLHGKPESADAPPVTRTLSATLTVRRSVAGPAKLGALATGLGITGSANKK